MIQCFSLTADIYSCGLYLTYDYEAFDSYARVGFNTWILKNQLEDTWMPKRNTSPMHISWS